MAKCLEGEGKLSSGKYNWSWKEIYFLDEANIFEVLMKRKKIFLDEANIFEVLRKENIF